ncbi:hypothetical protein [Microvirga pakistanensis]|uniref:hypothetical protein n=1 Tax=Microvirga pakistanensis TaxID=1682650 RepID=UPI00141B9EB0|nr:hypothetical protein [Microvirga pakistanensis]
MGIRAWLALASIAAAVVVFFFAVREVHTDPETAPGRAANKETVEQIPSNPDTVAPR